MADETLTPDLHVGPTPEDMPASEPEKAVESPVESGNVDVSLPPEASPVAAETPEAPVSEAAPVEAPLLPEVSAADLDSSNVALLAAEAHSLRAQHDADQEEIAALKARLAAAGLA